MKPAAIILPMPRDPPVINAVRPASENRSVIMGQSFHWQSTEGFAFPEKGWDKVMDLNVKSPFFLTQADGVEMQDATFRKIATRS